MNSKYVYVVSSNEKDIYQIEYDWRHDYYLTKLVFNKYKFSVKQILVAETVWYDTSIEKAREIWHKVAGWELINGLSVPGYIHEISARNVEPQYLKYTKRKKPIDIKYFQLIDNFESHEIEFFRRLPIT